MEFNSSFDRKFVMIEVGPKGQHHGEWCGLCFFTEDKTKVAIYDGNTWLTTDEFSGIYRDDDYEVDVTEQEIHLIDVNLIRLSNDNYLWANPNIIIEHFKRQFGDEAFGLVMEMKDNPPKWLRSKEDHSGMIFNPYNNSWSFF